MLEDEPEKIPDTLALLRQLRETLDAALDAALGVGDGEPGRVRRGPPGRHRRVAEELRQARWLLKERDEVIERAEHEAARIIDVARVRAERMVERTEVVREARRAAEDTIDQAGRLAAQMRLEAEDYVDRKLASFEVVLDRTMQQVAKGRERLSVHAPAHEDLLGPRPTKPSRPSSTRTRVQTTMRSGPHPVWVSDASLVFGAFVGVWGLTEKCSDLLGSGLCRGAAGSSPQPCATGEPFDAGPN